MPKPETKITVECGVTLPVGDEGFTFIKFHFGLERLVDTSDPVALKRAEKKLYEACEQIVDARVRRLTKVIKQAQKGK